MADYKVTLTSAGAALMAKCLAGEALEFTAVQLGDGDAAGSFLDMTALVSVKKVLPVSAISRRDNTAIVKAVLDFTSITEDFQWKEVGLIARDPDTDADVLYCYGNAGDKGDWITGGVAATAKRINITALVSSVAQVTAEIDNSEIYASVEALEEKAERIHNHDIAAVEGLSSALANKVEAYSLIPDSVFDCNDLPDGIFITSKRIANYPSETFSGRIISLKGSHFVQFAVDVGDGAVFYRTDGGGGFMPWQTIATATPPQMYEAPLANGYQHATPRVRYGKINGKLLLCGSFMRGTAAMAPMERIFTLPEGYRPSAPIGGIPVISTGSTWCGDCDIDPDGLVRWNGHGVSAPADGSWLVFSATTEVYLELLRCNK